jgi:hypothetical protein
LPGLVLAAPSLRRYRAGSDGLLILLEHCKEAHLAPAFGALQISAHGVEETCNSALTEDTLKELAREKPAKIPPQCKPSK